VRIRSAGSHRSKRWAPVLAFLILTPFGLAAAGDDIASAKQQLEQLRQRIGTLQNSLHSAEQRRQGLLKELRASEQQIGKLARGLRVIGDGLHRQQRQLHRLRGEREEQQELLRKQQEALRNQIYSAYVMGRQEQVKILLNQQDPAVVSRMMVYYDYLNRSRIEQVAEIEATLGQIRHTEQEIVREEKRLQGLQQQKEEEKERLELARSGRQEVMTALNAGIRTQGAELKTLQQDEQRLQELLARLEKERAAAPPPLELETRKPFSSFKGRMQWPAAGRLKVAFGTDKGGGLRWDGVLIAAPEGSEVHAVYHGRVVFADWLRGFGLLLIIDHGNGYMTLYGHNQSLFKEVGEWVEADEPVALTGNSGGRSEAGVYFEVRYQGRPENPSAWCRPVQGNRLG
jgi:septal ring factor EnvC (AmiA/AmiB activator)